MDFAVNPISPVGAEVDGLDLRRPLDRATVDRLLEAWHAHSILLFRGLELSQPQQFGFARCFGPLGVRKRRPENRPEGADADNVMLITNIRRDGVPVGSLPDGEMFFHHDMCYVEAPDIATMLYAIEVTSHGGNTLFADMYAAYDTLPPALKERIAGRRVLHVYNYLPTVRVGPDEDVSGYDHCWQPTVIVHPATRRKALYINELMSVRIEGLQEAENRSVLDEIFRHIARKEHVYEHVWKPGDLVMWDNRCTVHARTDFPADETRLLRRCTVAGAPLIAAESAL